MIVEEFEKLKKGLLELQGNDEEKISEIVNSLNIEPANFNDWLETIFSEKIEELNMDNLPYLLDYLYRENDDKLKVMLFCILLEATFDKIPFITNLENYQLFKEKYEALKHTLVEVSSMSYNGIADCMNMIIINSDPQGALLTEEEKSKLLASIEEKLQLLIDYISNKENVPNEIYNTLEILLDLSCYINNEKIEKLVEKISTLELNKSATKFLLKYQVENDIPLNEEKVNSLINDSEHLYTTLMMFERINKENLLPINKISQEQVAKSAMIDWLKYPTELGQVPDDIELLCEFERENVVYYAYKFKSKVFEDKGYMLAISGGYEKGKITSNNTGHTFSKFEQVEDDYLAQANAIVDMIEGYWKQKAEELEN